MAVFHKLLKTFPVTKLQCM